MVWSIVWRAKVLARSSGRLYRFRLWTDYRRRFCLKQEVNLNVSYDVALYQFYIAVTDIAIKSFQTNSK